MQLANSTNEPIPGYKVQERIGAGGYGEVWTVEAPGGLAKAIKFVYGYLDEERASRELKALNRIKSVRHPFLISLERIEVVEGQLVIITELAEGSLKDRFDQCQKEGLPGIPRDELLRYMRDTADALDYMSENYSLQHLDVKPENLLLVGRHVKVADFGLVKELHEVTGSLMGGLTPLYAPPESFDGRPSKFSDQYSLAIVYQEMLTGVLPFPGTTAAQLAAQHLHSKPQVLSLPAAEQKVVLKALSKDPAERFASCSELVEHLERAASGASDLPNVEAGQLSAAARAKVSATSQLAHISQLVEELNEENPKGEPAATEAPPPQPRHHASPVRESGWCIPPVVEHPQLETSTPIQVDESEFCLRPTLFIGIGGTAGHVLAKLSHRLHDRFDGKTVPIFRPLLLETDGSAAMQLAHAAEGNFDSQQVVNLPLRRPKDYRNTSRSLLQSISRRWIYNIPRSQQTEGIRPLGRLAFLDHADKVKSRIRSEIAASVHSDSVAEAQRLLQMRVDSKAPRIYLVSSISGGTGGGMLLDVAHLVKQTLGQMGLRDEAMHALLCHWTPRSQAAKDLAIANSYACLSELQQYSRTDRQIPGESAAGLEPLLEDRTLFEEIGLLHLGEEIGQRELEAGTRRAAEYLYLDTATGCGALFAKQKNAAEQRPPWDVRVKTFGLFEMAGVLEETVNEAARDLCSRVIQRWGGRPDEESSRVAKVQTVRASDPSSETDGSSLHGEATRLAGEKIAELQLGRESLSSLSEAALETVLGASANDCFQSLCEQLAAEENDLPVQELAKATEALFGSRATGANQEDELDESLRQEVQRHLADYAGTVGRELSDWILQLLDRPATRLKGAEQAAEWIKAYLRDLQDKLRESEQEALRELNSIPLAASVPDAKDKPKSRGRTTRRAEPDTGEPTDSAWRYFQLRWTRIANYLARRLAQSISVYVGGAADQLRDLGRECCTLQQQFSSSPSDSSVAAATQPCDDLAGVRQRFRQRLRSKLGSLTTDLDQTFCREHFAPLGGMHCLVTSDSETRNAVPGALFEAARRIIVKAQQLIDASQLLLPPETDSQESGDRLRRVVEGAKPYLSDCGGRRWLTVTLPEQADRKRIDNMLAEICQQQASFVTDTAGDFALLTTIDDIRLSQVAARLIDHRPDFAEAASRLYTRCDVEWTPWDDVQP